MMDRPFLSLIIPAWNEAQRLPGTLHKVTSYLDKQEYTSEVIVVDDGSTDETVHLVRQFMAEHRGRSEINLIEADHRGKGYAVRMGMLAGRGKYLMFSDADLATPVYELGKMIGALESGSDIAIGSRQAVCSERVNEPFLRHLLGRVFNLMVRLLAGLRFQDTQAGFKGFQRAVAYDLFRHVRLYGDDARLVKGSAITAFDVEVLYLAVQAGYRIEEIPVKWEYNLNSDLRMLHDGARMLSDLIKIRWMAMQGQYQDDTPSSER